MRETEEYNSFETLLNEGLFLADQQQKSMKDYSPNPLSSVPSDNAHYHTSLKAGFPFTLFSTIKDCACYLPTKNGPKQLLLKTVVVTLK